MAKEKFERTKPHANIGAIGLIPPAEVIMINGMPFDQEAVLAMPDGAKIWEEGLALNAGIKVRTKIRADIKNKVGDPESLLGTTADGAQLAVAGLLVDIIALDSAKTFAEYKAAKMGLISELVGTDKATNKPVNVVALAQGVIAGIKSGEVKLTAVLKGVPGVLAEIMERSTKVFTILDGAKDK